MRETAKRSSFVLGSPASMPGYQRRREFVPGSGAKLHCQHSFYLAETVLKHLYDVRSKLTTPTELIAVVVEGEAGVLVRFARVPSWTSG
jgi:hypothetical protein